MVAAQNIVIPMAIIPSSRFPRPRKLAIRNDERDADDDHAQRLSNAVRERMSAAADARRKTPRATANP